MVIQIDLSCFSVTWDFAHSFSGGQTPLNAESRVSFVLSWAIK